MEEKILGLRSMVKVIHHILYETTNLVNGKKYIGIHSTNNLDDGYIGCGIDGSKRKGSEKKGFRGAVAKYGYKNFQRKILKSFSSRQELIEAESEIVNLEVVSNPNYYNLNLGGKSTFDSMKELDESAFLEHQSRNGKIGAQAVYLKKTEEERLNWHSKGGKATQEKRKKLGLKGTTFGTKHSDEAKQKMSESCKKRVIYVCPVCLGEKRYDGGNFNKHMKGIHLWSSEKSKEFKENCFEKTTN